MVGSLINEVLNCRNLIVAKVAKAKLILDLFKNVDKLCDVIVAEILLWVFVQDFQVEALRHLFNYQPKELHLHLV